MVSRIRDFFPERGNQLETNVFGDGSFAVIGAGRDGAPRTYRYVLGRPMGGDGKPVVWVMLNPSVADAFRDDATIRKCKGFAAKWDASWLIVVNLFALRATHPSALKEHDDPVGPGNDDYLRDAANLAADTGAKVICGWGVKGVYLDRNVAACELLQAHALQPLALTVTKFGHPQHPLYVRYNAELQPYKIPGSK